jgi:ankyrin repeat protein
MLTQKLHNTLRVLGIVLASTNNVHAYNEQATQNLILMVNQNDHEGVKEALKQKANPNAQTAEKTPVLHKAIENNATDIVWSLLDGGAAPNSQDQEGTPALHKSIRADNFLIAALLIGNKANAQLENAQGLNALGYLNEFEETNNRSEIRDLLLEHTMHNETSITDLLETN